MLPLHLLALAFSLHSASPDSLSGPWQIKGDVMGNPINQICTFTQEGAVLSGRCDSEDGEPALLAGKIEGGKVTFWHGGDWDGQALTVVYAATFTSPTELKGTIEVRPMSMSGTFTATSAPVATPNAARKP